ncbi:MAG: DUF790 family protein [Lentisphaerae bacterium]|nr:DUF790 family protein [Lentisphaerota bacterium]
MLTKDLIKCHQRGGKVVPLFINADHPDHQGTADQLLAVFRSTPPPTRADIDQLTQPLIQVHGDPVLARGLRKLLEDRSDFGHGGEEDQPAIREAVFEASAAVLKGVPPEDLDAYREAVRQRIEPSPDTLTADLYADLPANEQLLRFRDLSARDLLLRYNTALVQALLLRARALEVELDDPDPAKLRRLLKYMRFWRLLATIRRVKSKRGKTATRLQLTIDGPASLFEGSKAYGLQLATFFPAVPTLDTWRLRADITWKGKSRKIDVSNKSSPLWTYRRMGAYVPDEIRMFHRQFKEKSKAWGIVATPDFLDGGDQVLVVPDLTFQDGDGKLIHLELFHRWHATPLVERLGLLDRQPDLPLVIGVDRSLAKRADIAEAIEESRVFAERGFLFRSYPSVKRVTKLLDTAASQLSCEQLEP